MQPKIGCWKFFESKCPHVRLTEPHEMSVILIEHDSVTKFSASANLEPVLTQPTALSQLNFSVFKFFIRVPIIFGIHASRIFLKKSAFLINIRSFTRSPLKCFRLLSNFFHRGRCQLKSVLKSRDWIIFFLFFSRFFFKSQCLLQISPSSEMISLGTTEPAQNRGHNCQSSRQYSIRVETKARF